MWIAIHTFTVTFMALTKLAFATAGFVAGVLAFVVVSAWLAIAWLVGAVPRGA